MNVIGSKSVAIRTVDFIHEYNEEIPYIVKAINDLRKEVVSGNILLHITAYGPMDSETCAEMRKRFNEQSDGKIA